MAPEIQRSLRYSNFAVQAPSTLSVVPPYQLSSRDGPWLATLLNEGKREYGDIKAFAPMKDALKTFFVPRDNSIEITKSAAYKTNAGKLADAIAFEIIRRLPASLRSEAKSIASAKKFSNEIAALLASEVLRSIPAEFRNSNAHGQKGTFGSEALQQITQRIPSIGANFATAFQFVNGLQLQPLKPPAAGEGTQKPTSNPKNIYDGAVKPQTANASVVLEGDSKLGSFLSDIAKPNADLWATAAKYLIRPAEAVFEVTHLEKRIGEKDSTKGLFKERSSIEFRIASPALDFSFLSLDVAKIKINTDPTALQNPKDGVSMTALGLVKAIQNQPVTVFIVGATGLILGSIAAAPTLGKALSHPVGRAAIMGGAATIAGAYGFSLTSEHLQIAALSAGAKFNFEIRGGVTLEPGDKPSPRARMQVELSSTISALSMVAKYPLGAARLNPFDLNVYLRGQLGLKTKPEASLNPKKQVKINPNAKTDSAIVIGAKVRSQATLRSLEGTGGEFALNPKSGKWVKVSLGSKVQPGQTPEKQWIAFLNHSESVNGMRFMMQRIPGTKGQPPGMEQPGSLVVQVGRAYSNQGVAGRTQQRLASGDSANPYLTILPPETVASIEALGNIPKAIGGLFGQDPHGKSIFEQGFSRGQRVNPFEFAQRIVPVDAVLRDIYASAASRPLLSEAWNISRERLIALNKDRLFEVTLHDGTKTLGFLEGQVIDTGMVAVPNPKGGLVIIKHVTLISDNSSEGGTVYDAGPMTIISYQGQSILPYPGHSDVQGSKIRQPIQSVLEARQAAVGYWRARNEIANRYKANPTLQADLFKQLDAVMERTNKRLGGYLEFVGGDKVSIQVADLSGKTFPINSRKRAAEMTDINENDQAIKLLKQTAFYSSEVVAASQNPRSTTRVTPQPTRWPSDVPPRPHVVTEAGFLSAGKGSLPGMRAVDTNTKAKEMNAAYLALRLLKDTRTGSLITPNDAWQAVWKKYNGGGVAAVQEAFLRPQRKVGFVPNPMDELAARQNDEVVRTTESTDRVSALGVPPLPKGNVIIDGNAFVQAGKNLVWSSRVAAKITTTESKHMSELYDQLRKNYGFRADQAWKFVWLETNHHSGAMTGVLHDLKNIIYKGDGIPFNGWWETGQKRSQLTEIFNNLQRRYNVR